MQKLTRVIIQPVHNLVLKMHVKLTKEKEGRIQNFHNEFIYDGSKYLRLDLQSFMTLEIISKNKDDWDKSKSILIDQRNVYQLIKGMEKSIDYIYNGKVFGLSKEGSTIAYSDMMDKTTVKIYNLGSGQRVIIKPAIIYDENDLTYEGVVFYINKTENYVELPIDAFEALYYSLKEVNLYLYSQALVNYYVSSIKYGNIESDIPIAKVVSSPYNKMKKRSVFEKGPEEFVSSTGMAKEPDIMADYISE